MSQDEAATPRKPSFSQDATNSVVLPEIIDDEGEYTPKNDLGSSFRFGNLNAYNSASHNFNRTTGFFDYKKKDLNPLLKNDFRGLLQVDYEDAVKRYDPGMYYNTSSFKINSMMNTNGIVSPIKNMPEEPSFRDYQDAQRSDIVKPSPFDNLAQKRNKNHMKKVFKNPTTYQEIANFEHRVDPDKLSKMISFPNKDATPKYMPP